MILTVILTLFIVLNVAIGFYDFSFYRIPNLLLAGMLVLYAFYAPIFQGFDAILISLITFAVVLIFGFGLYAFKFIGAGDAKYMSVASLWFGFPGVIDFLIIVALVGGGLGILYLLFRDHISRLSDWAWKGIQKAEGHVLQLQYVWLGSGPGAEKGERENIDTRMVPYGIAIATGAIITILRTPHVGI